LGRRVVTAEVDVRNYDALKAAVDTGHYIAAKHGVVGLMRTFAVELGQHMIRVTFVHPTQVNTPMTMNDVTFRLFRPDLENPAPDDFAPFKQIQRTGEGYARLRL
jgi:NAD(P)-dependent dehydrogenase (short-subunit alcohol dehydrogenase family)